MSVVVTMAGESRRFRRAGFTVPKYRLRVGEHTIFAWAVQSLSWYVEHGHRLVFVGRADDPGLGEFLDRELEALRFPASELVVLDRTTAGQAETALAAAPLLASDEALVVYNIDTHVRPGALDGATLEGDGCIPCFPGAGDGWSFVACDGAGRATAVRKKRRISPHCSVGLYAFRDLDLYREAYARTRSTDGERYVAALYDALIEAGLEIRMQPLAADDVVALGTPEQAALAGPISI
ncbi:MAG: hypothetical protein ACRDL5_19150 [Solirubrobacteraceae bacterium]